MHVAGTLADALGVCENGQIPLDRVTFYSAEIFLALVHIHNMGLIYRDLKPNNVILNRDGHIQLVDLGGIVDVTGTIGYHDSAEVMGGIFSADYKNSRNDVTKASSRGDGPVVSFSGSRNFTQRHTYRIAGNAGKRRAKSIMGTNG